MAGELFKQIGEGGAKLVYEPVSTGLSWVRDSLSSVVYCVARNILRKGDLEKEVATSMAIRDRAHLLGVSTKHLAIDYEHTDTVIDGKKAIRCPKAHSNLEKMAEQKSLSWTQRLGYCYQMLGAMASLHKLNYLHRDLKLDNFLTFRGWFGRETVKLNDFGTAIEQDAYSIGLSSDGNARAAPPEGVMSQKAEVYAMGLACINMLEEMCLQISGKKMLIEPTKSFWQIGCLPRKVKRGLNEYLVRHADAVIRTTAIRDFPRRLISWIWFKLTGKYIIASKHQKAVYRYIDALVRELKLRGISSHRQADRLGALFKEMMNSDPTKRLTMQEAQERLSYELTSTPVWAVRQVVALPARMLGAF